MADILESSQMYMVYSSAQLYRFLNNTCVNPGTRLQPINVDNLIRIMPYPPFGSDVDPYVSEVPYKLKSITWSMKDTGQNATAQISEPVMCFVEIYSLDPDQIAYPEQDYWQKYFQLGENSIIAPNGSLFITPNDSGEISIDLQDGGDDLMFGYGAVFTVTIGEEKPCFCRIDPVANIRSSDTKT